MEDAARELKNLPERKGGQHLASVVDGEVDEQGDDDECAEGDERGALVGVGALQVVGVAVEPCVLRHELVETGIDFVVVVVEAPVAEGERRHGGFVADVENDEVVGLDAAAPPLDLRHVVGGIELHERLRLGVAEEVVGVEVAKGGVGPLEGFGVPSVDVGVVDAVGAAVGRDDFGLAVELLAGGGC